MTFTVKQLEWQIDELSKGDNSNGFVQNPHAILTHMNAINSVPARDVEIRLALFIDFIKALTEKNILDNEVLFSKSVMFRALEEEHAYDLNASTTLFEPNSSDWVPPTHDWDEYFSLKLGGYSASINECIIHCQRKITRQISWHIYDKATIIPLLVSKET